MYNFKVLDLFSGVGGFTLGLDKAGPHLYETVAFCENDHACQKVLRKNFPNVPIFGNICDLRKEMIPHKINLIVGGFPCTQISVAGTKKGFRDEKTKERTASGLWFEYKRLIKEIEPNFVIIENVANLRTKGLAEVIKDLHEIGYVGQFHIISASSIGAVHLRERIWIVAWRASINCDHQRLSKTIATEAKAQRRRTEATIKQSAWWAPYTELRRMDDVVSEGLDKTGRERVKQMGNAIVPSIASAIASALVTEWVCTMNSESKKSNKK